ncbi:hypothetical protein SKAU_G00314910 [Synaphobranchus kaupii]|uniref:BHLH domain-containing protein n=1 Tax=Synaphobranchus kaupii TaxID=118154 RepID=A0A9Q1ESH8_SYNKA|nr:hypothetical protein SKAU_G00314910 [Synaphobranchus kaupii]
MRATPTPNGDSPKLRPLVLKPAPGLGPLIQTLQSLSLGLREFPETPWVWRELSPGALKSDSEVPNRTSPSRINGGSGAGLPHCPPRPASHTEPSRGLRESQHLTMDDILSQLLLSADQQQWGCEALLEQVSPSLDAGYNSVCSVSDPGHYSARQSLDAGYNNACSVSEPGHYSARQSSDAGYNNACSVSDPGYYSACGSVSPSSSVDSGCFSPPPLRWGAADCSPLPDSVPVATAPAHPSPAQAGRRSRSKHPGKKRQSASEREKLRMRDLAKAVHHLRTFLPPSVAPAGQTLTKIETLRLAVRYIARLSAQLEEDQPQGGPADSPPLLPGAQDDLRSSFQPSTDPTLMESLPSFQSGFPHSSDPLRPLLSYQVG